MRTGIIGTFAVSIAAFVMAYLTMDNGYVGLLFIAIGVAFAVCGVVLTAREQRRSQGR
jgi:uncharacterized membrane protein YccC